jgi:hypothetical protein
VGGNRNKGTQRELQQTPKWNKWHYKKREIKIKIKKEK